MNLARRGIPAVALVTSEFWPQGDFVARSVGMPDVPRVELPHPVAATGQGTWRRWPTTIRAEVIAVAAPARSRPMPSDGRRPMSARC